jgi:hypothetical protein
MYPVYKHISYLFLRCNSRSSWFLRFKIGNLYVVMLRYTGPTGSSSDYPCSRPFLPRSQVFAAVLK